MNILIFTIILISIFGPKIGGFIDLSILGGVLGLIVLTFHEKVSVSREYVIVAIFVATVALYSILVVLFNGMEDMHPILRHFRALISTLLLGLVFYNFSMNGVLSSTTLTNILIVVLLFNAIAIIVSIIIPEVKLYMAELYGFNKKFVDLRSFGLTAGYDTAGYLCIIGAALSSITAYYKGGVRYSLATLVFIAAAIFTSRSSMALVGALMIGVCVVYVLKGRWSLKIIAVAYIVFGVNVAIYYVAPLIISTFIIQTPDSDYTSNYAATNLKEWYDVMWILPEHLLSVLFGVGEVVKTSDLGYVSLIFMIGVLGLLLVASIYVYMFFVIMALRRSINHGHAQTDVGWRVLVLSLSMIIIFMYVINFKNLYFLTRGYHELIVIMFFYILGFTRREHQSGHMLTESNSYGVCRQ